MTRDPVQRGNAQFPKEHRGPRGDGGGCSLGVLVPCRNESKVLGRKLRNLALAAWPTSLRGHRLLVVDDGSDDRSLDQAAGLCRELFGVEPFSLEPRSPAELARVAQVSACAEQNQVRCGKAGALTHGIRALSPHVDIVVLTDADIVLRPGALSAIQRAFDRDRRVGMVCGAQEFVESLAADGACRGEEGGELQPAAGIYDRWTARVRAAESRIGKLFSVHGQLLAWRAELGIEPRAGIAADDLDLMAQVRAKGLQVELLRGARFLEVRARPGPDRERQALRRARAYVQFVQSTGWNVGPSAFDRFQAWAYRHIPGLSPYLALLAVTVAAGLAMAFLGAPWAGVFLVSLLLFAAMPAGRRILRLLALIAAAGRASPDFSDRWETAR